MLDVINEKKTVVNVDISSTLRNTSNAISGAVKKLFSVSDERFIEMCREYDPKNEQYHLNLIEHALTKKEANINARDLLHGHTPLMVAVSKGRLAFVDLLLRNGADVNEKSTSGVTALMIASKTKNIGIANALIEVGAKLDIGTLRRRRTALMMAAQRDRHQMVAILLENGADSQKRDKNGKKAIDLAPRNSKSRKLLQEYEIKSMEKKK